MFGSLARKIFCSANDRFLRTLMAQVDDINDLEPELTNLSDAELHARTPRLKERLAKGETGGDRPQRREDASGGGGRSDGVVAQLHAPDGALREVVDVALRIGPAIDVKAHRVGSEVEGVVHGVEVGWPVDMPRPAVDRRADGVQAQGRPRHLAVRREAQPPALHSGPAQLALVPVDRRV